MTRKRWLYMAEWLRSCPSWQDPNKPVGRLLPGILVVSVVFGVIAIVFSVLAGSVIYGMVVWLGAWAIFGLFWLFGVPVGECDDPP